MPSNKEAPRAPGELFKQRQLGPTENIGAPEIEVKALPLGAFSKFVLEEQSKLLAEVRAGLVDTHG